MGWITLAVRRWLYLFVGYIFVTREECGVMGEGGACGGVPLCWIDAERIFVGGIKNEKRAMLVRGNQKIFLYLYRHTA